MFDGASCYCCNNKQDTTHQALSGYVSWDIYNVECQWVDRGSWDGTPGIPAIYNNYVAAFL